MVKSMTGYGRFTNSLDNTVITVEVRTVNHRFLDLSVKMPKTLLYLEEKIKKKAQEYFKRGRIDVFVTIDGDSLVNRKLEIDWKLLDQYMENLNLIQNRYHMDAPVTLSEIIQLQEVFSIVEKDEENTAFEKQLIHSVEHAMELVTEMRENEGKTIEKELRERAEYIHQLITMVDEHRGIVIEHYKERIKNRVKEYVKNESFENDARILQEVALLAEKGDITEEVIRLISHIDQFLETLTKSESIGRKLDFIIQEMHREVNTIGAKSNDVKISGWVVNLKSEIEKLKEQSQNVE